MGKETGKLKNFVTQPFLSFADALGSFKRHENAREGVHSRTSLQYNLFLKQLSGERVPVNVALKE